MSPSTTLAFGDARDVVGVRSRHLSQAAAKRKARRANQARSIPVVTYRAVKARWGWQVIATQHTQHRIGAVR